MSEPKAESEIQITILNFQLQFPKAALHAMVKGHSWSGRVACSIMGDQRLSKIREQAMEKHREQFVLTDDEQSVIDHWNNHPLVKKVADAIEQGRKESRNLPFKSPKPKERSILQFCLDRLGCDRTKAYIDQYLAQCQQGKNFTTISGTNRNLAYKSLMSLLEKLSSVIQKGDTCWWMSDLDQIRISDPEAEFHNAIIKAYAERFLKGKVPELSGRDYRAVMRFGEALNEQSRTFPASREKLIEWGLKAADEYFPTNTMIYPAHLGGTRFLEIGIPQYFKRAMI